jgi:hypothetical protein
MSIQLNQPYKIIPDKYKVYQEHYIIPAEQSLVVPIKALGEEVACDIHWERNGELQVMHQTVFINENLMPIDLMEDEQLYALWKAYKSQLNDQ